MLVLGAQVLIGASYRVAFQMEYEKLSPLLKAVHASGLTLMLIVLALLLLTGPYHQIAERGQDTEDLRSTASRIMELALVPFAFGIGAHLFSLGENALGRPAAAAVAAGGVLAALGFWYALGLIAKRRKSPQERVDPMSSEKQEQQGRTSVKDRIDQVLTEARVILPGAQALLGFQFIAMLSESFTKLPQSSKLLHVGSLAAVALATVLLMTPAAYHRIVENGEATEDFYRVACRLILSSLVPLALGLSGDFFVVLDKVSESKLPALAGSLGMLALFLGCWFGLTFFQRVRQRGQPELQLARA